VVLDSLCFVLLGDVVATADMRCRVIPERFLPEYSVTAFFVQDG